MGVNAGNRVRGTSTTTGTGTYTVGAAPSGFQAFSTIADGTVVGYLALLGADWEVGLGTLGSSGTTIARTTILQSSNANAAVNWGVGTKEIAHVVPSEMLAALEYTGGLRNGNFTGTLKVLGAALMQSGINVIGSVGGTADAITGTVTGLTALVNGAIFVLVPTTPNTGDTTLNLNGIGAKRIIQSSQQTNNVLLPRDLSSQRASFLIYQSATDQFVYVNPASAQHSAWSPQVNVAADSPVTLGQGGNDHLADTTAGAITYTLPATPALLEQYTTIVHFKGAVNQVTIARNGNLINGGASDYTLRIGDSAVLFWTGDAAVGWKVLYLNQTNVTVNNDQWSGTDLAVVNGGTGASDAATARTNLGLGTAAVEADTKYAHRANNLSDLASASTARTNLGLGTAAVEADTKYAHRANNLSDLASASTARTNLGLGTIATQAANNVSISGGTVSGITDLAVADGGTGASTAANARTNLGLGTIATQDANNVTITGGSVTGITDLAVADGGTGASTAANARTNLGVTATGADTTYAFRANNLSDLASASTARTNLGLGSIATKAITVSTSDPSGTPADGDLWIKYTP